MRKSNGMKWMIAVIIAVAVLCIALLVIIKSLQLQETVKLNEGHQDTGNFRSYRDVSSLSFTRADGTQIKLSQYSGKTVVLVYWASWCPACQKELQNIDTLMNDVTRDSDTVVLLVDKLDGKKETREQALSYLENHGVTTATIFDTDLKVYNELGLVMIPTTLVIDPSGRLMSGCYGTIPGENQLMAMVENARAGNEAGLLAFLKQNMMDSSGALATTYLEETDSVPGGKDILSESLGLTMLYAVQIGDRALFDGAWENAQKQMMDVGLTEWVSTEDNEYKTNAAIDDLRIYRALYAANAQWGGYDEAMSALSNAMYEYNTVDGHLIDFYDSDSGQKADRLTLCYADFEALNLLCKADERWQSILDNSLDLVERGLISERFPLYRSYYDVAQSRYPSSELNMAEALVTLLNLSRVEKLPKETMDWLKARLEEGAIYMRYTQNGEPTADGRMESTAVYALCAMIALSQDDLPMAQEAIGKMDALRIKDVTSRFNGAFGNADGSGIYSFDQCMALLAYRQMEECCK